MSFTTDFKTIMTADSSLNGLVDGGIQYENLIDNWLSNTNDNTWVVYEYNKSQVDCISERIYDDVTINIIVIQRDSNDKVDTISERIITYLNNYSNSNIINIAFVQDNHGFNQNLGIYTNTLEFKCIYS